MTERIDHVAEAREALRGSGDGRNFATDASNNAIAHAVLALVEQQRIANLIALGEHWQKTGYDFADSMAPILRDDIRVALGLDH